jgi:hypothetical protein
VLNFVVKTFNETIELKQMEDNAVPVEQPQQQDENQSSNEQNDTVQTPEAEVVVLEESNEEPQQQQEQQKQSDESTIQLDTNIEQPPEPTTPTTPKSPQTPKSPNTSVSPVNKTNSSADLNATLVSDVTVQQQAPRRKVKIKLHSGHEVDEGSNIDKHRHQKSQQSINNETKKDIAQKENINVREEFEKSFVNSRKYLEQITRDTEKKFEYKFNYETFIKSKIQSSALVKSFNEVPFDHTRRVTLFRMLNPPTHTKTRQKVIADKESVIKLLESIPFKENEASIQTTKMNTFDSVQYSYIKGRLSVIVTSKYLIVTNNSPTVTVVKLKLIELINRKPAKEKNTMKWNVKYQIGTKVHQLKFRLPFEEEYELLMQIKDTYQAYISSKFPFIVRPYFDKFCSHERGIANIYFNTLRVLYGAEQILFAKEITSSKSLKLAKEITTSKSLKVQKQLLVVTDKYVAILDRIDEKAKIELSKLTGSSKHPNIRFPRIYPIQRIQEIIADKNSIVLYPSYMGKIQMDDINTFCTIMEKEFGIQTTHGSYKEFPYQYIEQVGYEEMKVIEGMLSDFLAKCPTMDAETIIEKLQCLLMKLP